MCAGLCVVLRHTLSVGRAAAGAAAQQALLHQPPSVPPVYAHPPPVCPPPVCHPLVCPPPTACRLNVDMLKLIQLGLTFTDAEGDLPRINGELCVWQFNFRWAKTGRTEGGGGCGAAAGQQQGSQVQQGSVRSRGRAAAATAVRACTGARLLLT